MVNENYRPDDAEDAVMTVLRTEGRASPYLIKQETEGFSKQDIGRALSSLAAAGWVSKRCRGLYDYVEDPRLDDESGVDLTMEVDESAGAVVAAKSALEGWDPENVDSVKARRSTVAVVEFLAGRDGYTPKREIVAWIEDNIDVLPELSPSTMYGKAVVPGLGELADAGITERVTNKGWRVVESDGAD